MKNTSKIYLFLTSLFFMFSPFSYGIVEIYFEDTSISDHIGGLISNSAMIIILVVAIFILIKKKKLLSPSKEEIKFLTFGFLSNIIIYFYVFQNPLKIDTFITIYFIILLILILYLVMIDHVNINYELWIFAGWFFILDLIHYNFISSHSDLNPAEFIDANFIQRILYITVPLLTISLFTIKIRKYKVMDYFSYTIIGIAILLSLIFIKGVDVEGKFILTLNLLIPFVILTDFIVSKIYKRFDINKLIFYIRIGTIIILMFIYEGVFYFTMKTYSDHNIYELVMITYVVIICNLIEYLAPKKITQ